MEIQIPLVIFTSFLAWAAGIFGTQCILALQKRGGAVQLPALICSAAVLVVGGIAVVFHLTHPFNLFNGFGHITSGITQELIAIVLLAVAMVLFFLMLRRSEDNTVPQWLAVVGIVLVLVLIVAMGHSYMMPSLPAWDTQCCSCYRFWALPASWARPPWPSSAPRVALKSRVSGFSRSSAQR